MIKAKRTFTAKLISGGKVHEFRQPYGYPILLCKWEMRDSDEIDTGYIGEPITCKVCLNMINGKIRSSYSKQTLITPTHKGGA